MMVKVNFSCGCRRWLDTWNHGKILAFAPFKKTIQHFGPLPKLIRKMLLFYTRFSQNRVKPYSDVFKEPIVTL